MKFGQFMWYCKRKKISKNSTKIATWKLVPGPFVFAKNEAQPLLENEKLLKQATYTYLPIPMQPPSKSNTPKLGIPPVLNFF